MSTGQPKAETPDPRESGEIHIRSRGEKNGQDTGRTEPTEQARRSPWQAVASGCGTASEPMGNDEGRRGGLRRGREA